MKISFFTKKFFGAFLFLFVCASAMAQINVTGKVVSPEGEPLPGVNIIEKGTSNGIITNADGVYQLNVSNDNAVLVFSFIGFEALEAPVNGRSVVDIVLQKKLTELDEVVVTALGMKREKKTLGYAMQEVNTKDFNEVRSENIANMLQGKVAGVYISQSSSGTGGSTRVIMRGLNSLSGNNQPLWVVDGVPIDNTYTGDFSQWGGSDVATAASEINPDDIESISVLKGPNAAALYGSRAQNGAVVITTKKAKQNQSMQVQYNGNYNWTNLYDGYDFQWEYGQGNSGVFDIASKQGWGPKMTGQTIKNWRDKYYDREAGDYAMTAQKDRVKNFFQTGLSASNSVSIQGGGENAAARFSFTDTQIDGVTPNNSIDRKYFDLSTNYKYERLTVGVKGTYTRQETKNRVALGEYGLMQMFTKMPANIRLEDLQDNLTVDDIPMNWTGPSNEFLNPYNLVSNKKSSITKRDRFTGVVNASFKITDWLSVAGKTGMDYWHDHNGYYSLKSVNGQNPSRSRSEVELREVNSDIMLKIDKTFNDFTLNSNIGAAVMNRKYNSLGGSSGTLVIYGFNNLSNGSSQTASEYSTEKEIQSVLGNVQLGFRNYLFLDVTGRNDWSSTLPANNRSYFYPSVSLSGILSDIITLPESIDFLKLRGSWAQVGNDTDPYRLSQVYSFSKINGNLIYATLPNTQPFYNLKPEETTSWEGGFDFRMYDNRLGLDLTYYNSNTINQILTLAIPQSTGYTSKFINAGKIKSSGLEIMLNTVPVRTKDLEWQLNFNWGTNTTECVALNEDVKTHVLGSMRIGQVVVKEGEKFGDIMSEAFKRDEKGNVLVDDNGLPIATSDYVKVGNMLPDWTGAVTSRLTYKNLTLNMLLDIRYGGDILSVTDALATQAGTSTRTLEGRDKMVVEGIVASTGEKNAKEITSEQYWSSVGGPYGIGEAYIYDATYMKLREISLGYNIPQSLLSKVSFIKNAKLSLVGRDLFYLVRHTPGTNPEGASNQQDWSQAFELNSLPPTNNIGFNINLTF
ncbi:TonB-linked outer membrane protein, SusC/RagA family [Mariniphaga anaerophila]|uniref:TonB-linked outer membrane protein, SusC/RagA family n=1 Tax=Mariniphaga anaerophila TaxID=1484053 RepID=A0A1M5ESP9_9BACT|nr:SusC/RagA family TonB-linked outer membrane protein [Mariniphaga anaerophila]SHF82164.1 TonB-linked outer membrane protein, SusC/RagA family [Mariniphaga anaerophila]